MSVFTVFDDVCSSEFKNMFFYLIHAQIHSIGTTKKNQITSIYSMWAENSLTTSI